MTSAAPSAMDATRRSDSVYPVMRAAAISCAVGCSLWIAAVGVDGPIFTRQKAAVPDGIPIRVRVPQSVQLDRDRTRDIPIPRPLLTSSSLLLSTRTCRLSSEFVAALTLRTQYISSPVAMRAGPSIGGGVVKPFEGRQIGRRGICRLYFLLTTFYFLVLRMQHEP